MEQVEDLKNKGNLLFKERNYQEAVQTYKKAIAQCNLNNNNDLLAKLHHNCSLCFSELQQHELAYIYSKKAIKLNENDFNLMRQGNCLLNLLKFNEASKCFKKALKLNPKSKAIQEKLKQTTVTIYENPNLIKTQMSKFPNGIMSTMLSMLPINKSKIPDFVEEFKRKFPLLYKDNEDFLQ
ncbi:hypothetical protein ABK040_003850 [Willaertia magna]